MNTRCILAAFKISSSFRRLSWLNSMHASSEISTIKRTGYLEDDEEKQRYNLREASGCAAGLQIGYPAISR